MDPKEVCIICSGGGMKCSYSGGFLLALEEKYPNFKPGLLIGNSGGSGNIAYYAAGQMKEGINAWKDFLLNKNFLSSTRIKKILDVDYLVDEIFKKKIPLRTKEVISEDKEIFFSVTNSDLGKVEFLSPKKHNCFEILRASKALPFFYNRKVKIGNYKYIDGALHPDTIEKSINKAIELGAKKIIVVDNSNVHGLKYLITHYAKFFDKNLYGLIKKFDRESKDYLLGGVEVLFITPSEKLVVRALSKSKKNVHRAVELGYRDAINNERIKEIFSRELKQVIQ